MPDPPASPMPSSWQVSEEELAQLLSLHREQLLLYDELPTEPDEGAKAEAKPPKLNLDGVEQYVRELVAQYEGSRPGVKLKPLRYITVGGPDGTTVAGTAELPDSGLVTLVVTQTILDSERAEVSSRILVASACKSRKRTS